MPTIPENILGAIGLQNLGNTCYMNAVLQCLFHAESLKEILNVEGHEGHNDDLVSSYKLLLESYLSKKELVIIPAQFVLFFKTTQEHVEQFNNFDQQDAVQFLQALLDGLHLELNGGSSVASQWDTFIQQNKSIIIDTCYGCQHEEFECNCCKGKNIIKDPFICLNLAIPEINRINLDFFLNLFYAENSVQDFTCPLCQNKCSASKNTTVFVAPEILILTFN